MVKKLRNKFVIVTTSLMVIVLGGVLLVNTLYNNYWNDLEIVDMLEWIAYSGIFNSSNENISDYVVEEFEDRDKPIVGILLDNDFKLEKRYILGNGKDIEVPEKVLVKMCEKRWETNKIGKFYFSFSEPDSEHILLVIMDSHANEKLPLKILGRIGLGAVGILMLILITFYLSRFVTEPAEHSLNREKRFISDAGHELKTPLGAISINAQAIKVSGEDNIYIDNIISESERMNRLIERLLTLSRLDEEPEVVFEQINLSELCEEMALTYEVLAFEKKIELKYDIKESVLIKGNQDEMKQLIAILLDNAVKNTPEAGAIWLQCCENRGKKIIEVSNTGKGILKEDLAHVFDRFYTSDQARNSNSFGLGLAIAKAIVERHEGSIEADSIPGEKTTFLICL